MKCGKRCLWLAETSVFRTSIHIYVGDWADGLQDGNGELQKVDGEKIRGVWEKGVLTWSEIMVQASTATGTTAEMIKETVHEKIAAPTTTAKVTHIEYTDAIYDGETKNGQPHGNGKLVFSNGNSAEGQFSNGQLVYGTFRWVNGDVYEGEFADSSMNGQGKLTLADGTIVEGQWIDGQYAPPPTAPTEVFNFQNRNNLLDRINSDLMYAYDKLEYYRLDISDLSSRGAFNSSMMDSAKSSYEQVENHIDDLQSLFEQTQNATSNSVIMDLYNDVLEVENDLVNS